MSGLASVYHIFFGAGEKSEISKFCNEGKCLAAVSVPSSLPIKQ